MSALKRLAKEFVLKTCGPDVQHRIRRSYTAYKIKHESHFREPEMTLIKSLVSAGDVVADIGANVGVYTNELSAAVGARGKVYSFEPVMENYDILLTVIRKVHLENVSPFQVALGATVADCEIIIPQMSGFSGYYWAHLAKDGEQGRRESIRVTTLDELRRSGVIAHLDFAKCDVEGGELGVIMGGEETIRSQTPGWLMEVSRDTSAEVFTFFRNCGYCAFVFDGRLVETQNYRDKEFSNYFFLHPDWTLWERVVAVLS
jgi:FkbM family methyltransferase